MESCKKTRTPMPTSCYLDANKREKFVDQTKYSELIGSSMFT